MVELADTSDLGSDELSSWRFESSYPHNAETRERGLGVSAFLKNARSYS